MGIICTNTTPLNYNQAINSTFQDACKPLFRYLNLTHFIYIKLLKNNKRLYLCNDTSWIEEHLKHQLYNDTLHESRAIQPAESTERLANWEGYGPDKVFNILRTRNMANGFIIYRGNEIFSFCSTCENTNISYSYIHNLDVLRHFILYFKNKCADIIAPKNDGRLITSDVKTTTIISEEEKSFRALYEQMKLNSFILDKGDETVRLTKREVEALIHFSSGKNILETAWLMKISSRTVQSHLNNIKNKFHCNTKSKIIDLFQKSDLRDITIKDLGY